MIKHLEIEGKDISTYTKPAYIDVNGNEVSSEIDWNSYLSDYGTFSFSDGFVEDIMQYVKSNLDQDKTLMNNKFHDYSRATSLTPEFVKSKNISCFQIELGWADQPFELD